MTKYCNGCKTEKDWSEYFLRPDSGRPRALCKVCYTARRCDHRRRNAERYRKYNSDERKANRPHERFKARVRYNSDPEYRVKNRARAAVYRAIQRGDLIKQPCGMCGTDKSVQGHHHDYSKPLDVEWLCYHCHMKEHGVIA